MSQFARALLAFIALPGTVAFLVPVAWVWRAHLPLREPMGLLALALGTVGLLWCVRDFHASGKGTLAPWAPPRELVVVGLYRYSRNPMYVSVLLVLLGWAMAFASRGLLLYALAVALAFHLRVVFGEEPWLARTARHGRATRTACGAGSRPRMIGPHAAGRGMRRMVASSLRRRGRCRRRRSLPDRHGGARPA